MLSLRSLSARLSAIAVAMLVGSAAGQTKAPDYTRSVDPFIGVDWGGNTFVGAALPFGMV